MLLMTRDGNGVVQNPLSASPLKPAARVINSNDNIADHANENTTNQERDESLPYARYIALLHRIADWDGGEEAHT